MTFRFAFWLLLQQVVLLLVTVHHYNTLCNKGNLYCQAVLLPEHSAWQHLFDNADDTSFLLMTGVSRDVFHMLLNILYPNQRIDSAGRRKGRPRSLLPHAELGLFLFFVGSTMNIKHLCLIFGTVPSVCSRSLKKLLKLIPRKLWNHPFAKIEFPDENKMAKWAAMIKQREPIADDVIGFMDGLSLHSECSSERTEQNSMYNGYHSDTMVNNVFAYGADGKVFICGFNFVGSVHDGSIASTLLPTIRNKIGHYKICVDQGFPRTGDADGILVGPYSRRSAANLAPTLREYLLRLSNCYVSLRQASEWGMRGLQGSFPRIKRRLPSNRLKRRRIIESIVHLHNFRTHVIGCNQINKVFDPEYESVIQLNGNDRIRRYYYYDT